MRGMSSTEWRVPSDYIGAGKFVVTGDSVIVGTDYGVQCLPYQRSGPRGWKAKLDSRCVGVAQGPDGTLLAACANGLYSLTGDGVGTWGTESLSPLVGAPAVMDGGVLMMTTTALHFVRPGLGVIWGHEFAEVLGSSVESIRPLNLFVLDGHVIAGIVDYDSGIGRVLVFDGPSGEILWQSEPGPVSELFPAGQRVFVWSQTGYGKFETRMTRLDGHEIWVRDFAGLGAVGPDGSLSMIVGSNESPTWDDWELRRVSNTGKVEVALRARGRCAVRPLFLKDGSVYFIGSTTPIDLGASRVDYTSFFAMPQEVVFQHLMDIKPQFPECDISLLCHRPGEASLKVLFENSKTYSFGGLRALGRSVVFSDGTDIVAVKVG